MKPQDVRNIRIGLAAFVAVVLLLIFAVPRSTPPAATLANPNEAFVDRAGIVSPDFARQWAGGLLDDDRAEIVVYVDRNPLQGEIAAWAIQAASDWKIGASRNDTGLVIFVFTDPRIARIDVGYGLEDRLTDARVRQLLEAHLAPAFAAGQYEKGFDALLFAIRREIGGDDDASIQARAQDARKRDDTSWWTQIRTALPRVPGVTLRIARAFLVGGTEERLGILIAAAIGLVILAFGVVAAVETLRRIASVPSALRTRREGAAGAGVGEIAFQVTMGLCVCFVCLTLVTIVVLAAGSYFTREGRFGGAGAMIVWPQTPRS